MRKDEEVNPLISIIVPVYNTESYIERCIESIINQTYKNLEIILVNDGSTDNSGKIGDAYARKDERIKVIHKKNGGLVSARKAGVAKATGDYITYVDSDDWIDSVMYEELIREMLKYDADIVTSGLYREYPKSVVKEFDNLSAGVYVREEMEEYIFPKLMYTGNFFEAGINMHLYNKVYKRKLIESNQIEISDIIRVGDDAALVYPCIIDAKKIVILHKCFYHYCIRNNSTMGSGYKKELSGFKMIHSIIKRKIEASNGAKDTLMKQLNFLMLYMFLLKEPQLVIRSCNGMLFPFENVHMKDRVILYGSGKFGSTLYRYLTDKKWCDIIFWVDRDEDTKRGVADISILKDIQQDSYDKVIIAVLVGSVVEEICKQLVRYGIQEKKIACIDMKNETINLEDILGQHL